MQKHAVHWSLKFWVFTFWNLLQEITCGVALAENVSEPDPELPPESLQ